MAQFQFRMATLLRLRESWRDERRAALAEAQHAEQVIAERIALIDCDLVALRRQSLDAARPGVINVDRLADSTRYEMILKVERQSADQQRQAVAEEVERRRESLMTADRDVRVLEKLRESQLDQHRDAQQRSEVKQLDEISLLRHSRMEQL